MTTKRLKPGQVTTIRVSPQDCMAVVDILIVGVPLGNLSFAQATKLAFSSMAESMRQNQIIPRRLGYEYLEMMDVFKEDLNGRRAAKLGQTSLNDAAGRRLQVAPVMPETPEMLRVKRAMDQLQFKRENDSVNWTAEDEAKWAGLCGELFQLTESATEPATIASSMQV